jgi:hypothetical protein
MPQALVARNSGFVTVVRRDQGLALLLDGEAWKAQLDPGHPLRTTGFQGLRWVDPAQRHQPERWTSTFCEDFAEIYVDEQAGDATLLTTPAHDDVEQAGAVRRRDLELAAMCADHVRGKALREPATGDAHRIRRQLFATVLLRAGLVSDNGLRWLIDAYASIDVDGYVLWAVNFTGTLPQIERVLAMADGLSAATGRPVVVAGVGRLWQLALSHGVAAAIFGQKTALTWPPDALDPSPITADEQNQDDGRGVAVYHGAILSAIRIGEPGDVDRRRLFIRHECGCGHHREGTPPQGQREILAHNIWWTMREARQACLPSVDRSGLALALRAVAAVRNRERLGLKPLKSGWRAILGDVGQQDAGEPGGDA